MKNLITFFVLLCYACAKPDIEAEKKIITQLLYDETNYAATADTLKWYNCWINTDEARFMFVAVDGVWETIGWSNIKDGFKGAKPFDLKLKRDNYTFNIGNDVAIVSFDQQDNWGGTDGQKKKETRTLKKDDGKWKIVGSNVIAVSSFEKKVTAPFHIAKEKMALVPRASFRFQTGLGGMAVGYMEAPAGMDFTPLLVGLPNNMCPSPHWGYVFEGSLRMKFPDGKEAIANAGEVFYWPAPHTGVVEKNVKYIEFSPEPEFTQLMNHMPK